MANQILKNRYDVKLTDEDIINYFESLKGSCFKILPIYEGKDLRTKQLIYTDEEAYINFQVYLSNFIVELEGASYFFNNNIYLLKLINSLKGLQHIGINKHDIVKSITFKCCYEICQKIIYDISNN